MDDKTIFLYSTGCPRCFVLKRKLDEKGISYEVRDVIEEMLALGFQEVPVLKVGERLLNFTEAVKWVNSK